jgi:hypothetical protein
MIKISTGAADDVDSKYTSSYPLALNDHFSHGMTALLRSLIKADYIICRTAA